MHQVLVPVHLVAPESIQTAFLFAHFIMLLDVCF